MGSAQQLADQAATHRCETVVVLRDKRQRELRLLPQQRWADFQPQVAALEAEVVQACTPMRLHVDDMKNWGLP